MPRPELQGRHECVSVCVGRAMSPPVRCNRTGRQAGGRLGVSGHTPVTTHHTSGSHIPQCPHQENTMNTQSHASRTSGSSNAKYSHRGQKVEGRAGAGQQIWEVSTDGKVRGSTALTVEATGNRMPQNEVIFYNKRGLYISHVQFLTKLN